MWKWIANWVLMKLRAALTKVSEADVKKLACILNKKVDIPGLSEETEGKIIQDSLLRAVDVVKELLEIIKF